MSTIHGGPDMLGVPAYDLSTNANACGPHGITEQAVREANARHYPDPAYTALAVQLAAWHGVAPSRIVLGASGSELIQRVSAAVAFQTSASREEASACWPVHAYGDYARAAQATGLRHAEDAAQASLIWACDPSSPLGQPHHGLAEMVERLKPTQALVLDQAYEPLRLSGALALDAEALDRTWRLIIPNKALGLTGVRAAYLLAPRTEPGLLQNIRALAPSWPLGAHGVALLQSWATVDVHQWLAECRTTLRAWKARQLDLLRSAGWHAEAGVANFLAITREGIHVKTCLDTLRRKGIKLRDCASFGLPGHLRLAVVEPDVQDILMHALYEEGKA